MNFISIGCRQYCYTHISPGFYPLGCAPPHDAPPHEGGGGGGGVGAGRGGRGGGNNSGSGSAFTLYAIIADFIIIIAIPVSRKKNGLKNATDKINWDLQKQKIKKFEERKRKGMI